MVLRGWVVGGVCAMALSCGDSDGSGGIGLGTRGCLSDREICQFEPGVSTPDDVQAALGNAQQFLGAETWLYVCQEITGQQIVHNDLVVFDFYEGVLDHVMVLRQGTGATPPPDCEAMREGAGGSGADECAAVPLPEGGAAPCTSAVFGSVTVSTTCTEGERSWSQMCSGSSCTCSFNDQYACECVLPEGEGYCCPGLPGHQL